MTAFPEPTTIDISRERAITYTWPLRHVTDGEGDTGTEVIELTVRHDRERKELSALLAPVTILDREGPCTVRKYTMFAGTHIARSPISRYSAKQLQHFGGQMLHTVMNGHQLDGHAAELRQRILDANVATV